MRWRLAQEAAEDLINIQEQSIRLFGEKSANTCHASMKRAFERLAAFPETGRPAANLGHDIRVHPIRSHIILYREARQDFSSFASAICGRTG